MMNGGIQTTTVQNGNVIVPFQRPSLTSMLSSNGHPSQQAFSSGIRQHPQFQPQVSANPAAFVTQQQLHLPQQKMFQVVIPQQRPSLTSNPPPASSSAVSAPAVASSMIGIQQLSSSRSPLSGSQQQHYAQQQNSVGNAAQISMLQQQQQQQ
eukprot:GDKK01054410.1.p1 GENE.GDKK01054410.1~~GDKK01054410.1.p1  ORF type:complete len:152 (-),score=57.36 GDKK01054410.1:8-463(-)